MPRDSEPTQKCSCRSHDFGCIELAAPIKGRVIPGGMSIGPTVIEEWPEVVLEDLLDAEEIE